MFDERIIRLLPKAFPGKAVNAQFDQTESSTGSRLAGGAIWSVGGAFLFRVLTLMGSVVVARILGPHQYGELAIVQGATTSAGALAGMGLGLTATKCVAELRERDVERLRIALTTCERTALVAGTGVSIVVALNADPIATHVLGMGGAAPLIAVAALGLVFGSIDGYQTGVLVGAETLRELTLAVLVASLIALPISVLMAAFWGLPGAVWGGVIGTLVQCLASRVAVTRVILTGLLPRRSASGPFQWTLLWDSCFPAMLAGLVVTPAHWICQVILLRRYNGAVEVACLAVAFQWFQAILFVPVNAGRIVLPLLTDSIAASKVSTSMTVLTTGVFASAVVTVPLIALVAVGSRWIVSLYGALFAPAAPVVAVVAVAAGLVAIQAHVGHLVIATGRFWMGLAMNVGWAMAYVGLSWLFIDHGALGIAVALATAYLLHASWTFTFARSWMHAQSQRITPRIGH